MPSLITPNGYVIPGDYTPYDCQVRCKYVSHISFRSSVESYTAEAVTSDGQTIYCGTISRKNSGASFTLTRVNGQSAKTFSWCNDAQEGAQLLVEQYFYEQHLKNLPKPPVVQKNEVA